MIGITIINFYIFSGKKDQRKEKVFIISKMEVVMKVIGYLIIRMVLDNLFMPMVINTKENLGKEKKVVEVFTFTVMETDMKVKYSHNHIIN